jgi:hypothetical protein
VPTDAGQSIAARAMALVGSPFRLHGRNPETGIDCVGVVAASLSDILHSRTIPSDYVLRGSYGGRVSAFLDAVSFGLVKDTPPEPGDILMISTAPRQIHLAVVVPQGAVHAHAGLRRVVLAALPLPWPLVGHWRYLGSEPVKYPFEV